MALAAPSPGRPTGVFKPDVDGVSIRSSRLYPYDGILIRLDVSKIAVGLETVKQEVRLDTSKITVSLADRVG